MSFDAVMSIAKAEEEANAVVSSAQNRAKQMLADAENAGKATVEAAVAKADGELSELKKLSYDKAVAEAATLSEETEAKKAGLRAKAENRLAQAATLVVERIVNS